MTSDLPFDSNPPLENSVSTGSKSLRGLFLVGITGMFYLFFIYLFIFCH